MKTNLRTLLGLLCVAAIGASCGDEIRRTQSNDIFLGTDNIVFSRVPAGQSDPKLIEIRQGGETDLRVDEVYLIPRPADVDGETIQETGCASNDTTYQRCDRKSLGLTANEPLPAELDAVCLYLVDERPDLPLTLAGDEFRNVVVRYRSVRDVPPPAPALLVVKSNALDKTCLVVEMQVQSATPKISATETTISFPGGNIPQSSSLLIKNVGSGELQVSPFTLSLLTPTATDPMTGDPVAEFRIEVDTDFPWSIPVRGSENVTVFYDPVDDVADKAELVFRSNDTQNPELTITLTSEPIFGVLNATPNPIIFDTPPAGGQVEKVLTLSNSGLKKVDVLAIIVDPPSEDYKLGPDQTSFQLGGGASREVRVIYKPTTAEGSSATLVVDSNADNADAAGKIQVQLAPQGAALPAILSVDPVSVDMSDVAEGMSGVATLTLSNLGSASLDISSIALSGADMGEVPATDPEFEITAGGGATTIAPNETHEVQLTFTRPAGDLNLHIGALVIESNAGSSPDVIYITANAPAQ